MKTINGNRDLQSQRKEQVRRQMIALRKALSPGEVRAAASGFHKQLLDLLHRLAFQPGRVINIAAYAAVHNEADLSDAWPDLSRWPSNLYFPAINGHGGASCLVLGKVPSDLLPDQFLVRGRFGIPEPPKAGWHANMPELDLILVPGLAFDRSGGRLGWGKAYYDRLLAALPGSPVRIGVGYGFQIVSEPLPLWPSDEKMDWLLTQEGYFSVKTKK